MPNQLVISNNTPLSALWSIQQLNLLQQLYGQITIPVTVMQEFLAVDTEARQAFLNEADWIQILPVENSAMALAFADLDQGEADVLALAYEQPTKLVIIDEKRGRRHAKRLSLTLTGTVGVLLLAKQEGLILSLKEQLDKMIEKGFFVHPSLVDRALEIVGEFTPE